MDDDDKYLIKIPKQILAYLRLITQERCLISAAFGDQTRLSLLTAILAIDTKKQRLVMDFGSQDHLNKRLLGSAVVQFTTEYQGVKIRFEGRGIKKINHAGQAAFSVNLPTSLYWRQRRQFYRVKLPLSRQSYCTVVLFDFEAEQKIKQKFLLYDLSAIGFSLLLENSQFSEQFTPGTEFHRCYLALTDKVGLYTDIKICHKIIHHPDRGDNVERIGCHITNATPRIESAILRYMQDVEREFKHKEK